MSYLLLSLITIISLYSHPTISADFSITGSNYKLSTDAVYAIYNPSSRQYMGFDGYDIMFVDDISDDYNTKWQIELQQAKWHSFALKNVGTGKYILYENLDWRLESTAHVYNEWYMGFTADFHGVGDVKNLPTVHIWTPEFAGIQYRMETFTYMGSKKISALCNTHAASLQSTSMKTANNMEHNCGGLNEAKFIFIPEYQFSEMSGGWQSIPSCIGCESTEYEYSVGVTGLTQTEISSSWSNSVSKEVSAGFEFGPFSAGGGVTGEESQQVSTSMTQAFEHTATETYRFTCTKDLLYQWTISGTSNSFNMNKENFRVSGPTVICIKSGYTPQCLPNKCKSNTNCQECVQ